MKTTLAILAVHVALTVFLSLTLNVWSDESCTLVATGGQLDQALIQAIHFEWQPPTYYLGLCLWRKIDDSIFFARLISVVCTSLSILVITAIGKRLAPKTPSGLLAAVFALHPFTIYAAVEVRLYGFAMLLSALLLLFFLDGYWQDNRRARVLYIITAIIALYTNVILALPLIAFAGALLCTGRFKSLANLLMSMLLVAVAYFPMLVIQLGVARGINFPNDQVSLWGSLNYVIGSTEYMIWPLPRSEETKLFRALLLLGLVVVTSVLIWKAWPRVEFKHRLLSAYLVILGLLLAIFIIASGLAAAPRYAYVMLVPSILCWAMLVEFCQRLRWRFALLSISLVLCVTSLIIVYQPLCKTGDWIRVVNYLEQHEKPGQPIVAFISEVETLIDYYYEGPNQVVPLPSPQRFDRFDYTDFAIPDRQTLESRWQPIIENSNEIWLVTYDDVVSYQDAEQDVVNYRFVEEFVNTHYTEVKQRRFYHSTVRLLQRKSDSAITSGLTAPLEPSPMAQ